LNKPFSSYKGSEPYIFVCYAHSDSDTVYVDLKELHGAGIKFWYDEGIQAGSVWRAEIASSIKAATKFIFFISEASLKSAHCLREVDYALNNDIEVIPVYLDDCSLPDELELVFNRVQALFRHTDTLYMQHLQSALKKGAGMKALKELPRRRSSGFVWVLALVVGALLISIWMSRETTPRPAQIETREAASPSAFDRYSQGQELMLRWDKDDNLDAAIELFREASELDPGFALTFARLAEALRIRYALSGEDNWLEEAAVSAHEADRLNPGLAPVQVALGRIYASQGKHDMAFAVTERAVSIDPNDAAANQAMSRIYENLGRMDDAENSGRKALALDPDNIMILDGFANFLFYQGRYEEAAEQWQKVIKLAPDHYAALVNLGSALNESGQTPEAITIYERAIEIKPTYMGYSNLGTAYSGEQRYENAVKAYHKALEINDTDWLAWGNLAYVYSRMNGLDARTVETFDKAIQLAEAAKQQNSRDPYVYSDLSLYYARTGQSELALQRLNTAITLAPDSGEILAAAADVYEIVGQRDKAIEMVKKSLEFGYSLQQLKDDHDLADLFKDPEMQTLSQ
jgi:tetratricopeptide (TPR) repeat protein